MDAPTGRGLTVLAALLFGCASAYAAADPITIAKATMTAAMRDPTSVLFRDVRLNGTCDGKSYVEGWANGKNAFGGYGGFKIFVVSIEGGHGAVMQADGVAYATDAEFLRAALCGGNHH